MGRRRICKLGETPTSPPAPGMERITCVQPLAGDDYVMLVERVGEVARLRTWDGEAVDASRWIVDRVRGDIPAGDELEFAALVEAAADEE